MKQPKKQQWNMPHKYNQSKQSERYLEHGKMIKISPHALLIRQIGAVSP